MEDNILGVIKDSKCPECGSKKIICILQYPLIVEKDMKGRPIFKDGKGKRKYYPSNKDMARAYKGALNDEYQCANYECKVCGWISETYTP